MKWIFNIGIFNVVSIGVHKPEHRPVYPLLKIDLEFDLVSVQNLIKIETLKYIESNIVEFAVVIN